MSRSINQATIDLIKTFEGWSPEPYLCPARVWTIGWGATRGPDGGPVTASTPPISQEIGEALLLRDCSRFSQAVSGLIVADLNDNQFGALVSFTYNLGPGRLRSSTLRALVNRGDFDGAAGQFQRWVYAGGVRLNGLVRRREAERRLFLSPVWAVAAEPPESFWDRLARSFQRAAAVQARDAAGVPQ